MSRRRAARAAATVLALCAGALSACSSGSSPSTTVASSPRIPSPIDGCTPTNTPWRALEGLQVDAAALGSGPAVIFANEGGNDVCGWIALADRLVATGHRVAVFTYSNPSASADAENLETLLAVASATAQDGKYALIGASIGGRLVIEAAATRPTGLAGIVSLSGETTLPDGRDILPDARKVTLPALYAGARTDSYTDGTKQQDALHNAMHGVPNELVQRPGDAHGTELLTGSDGAVVVPRVVAFVQRVLA